MIEPDTIPANKHEAFNAIIHIALRRDLDRLEQAMADELDEERRQAIGRHMAWVLDFLHHHHTGEDEGVWPAVLAKNPGAADLLEEMEGEHERLAEAASTLGSAVDRLARDGSIEARDRVAEATSAMRSVMEPHLLHEEDVAMPVVVATLDKKDWKRIEKEHFNRGLSWADQGYEILWVLDGLDPGREAFMRRWLTPPILWLVDRWQGPRYGSEAALCWG